MPKLFPIMGVGEHGIVTDLPDFQLPPNAWSGGQNVRFYENRAAAAKGYEDAFTPSIPPYAIDVVTSGGDVFFVYPGLDDIYTYDVSNGHVERTRAAGVTVYTGTAADIWNGGVLHDYHCITNGVDAPQVWKIGTATDYADMDYDASNTWTAAGQTCRILVPVKYHLLAMDLTVSGSRYPRRVAWPEPAEPGSMPTDWDPSDPTNRAGWVDLVGGSGIIQTAEGMGESVIAYTDDLAFRIDWVGGTAQFDVNTLEWAKGAVSRRAVAVLPGGSHFVVAAGDIYIHNGQGYEAIADEKRKRTIFADVSPDNYKYLFVVANYAYNEVIVALPTVGATFCDKAHVYNYKRKAWSERAIPNLMGMAEGPDPSAAATPWLWSDMTATTWEEMTFPWAGEGYNPLNRSMLAVSPSGSGAVYRMDATNQADGANINAYLERTGLVMGDGDVVNTITGMVPRIKATGAVSLQVGGQMYPGGPVTWSPAVSFNPTTDQRATFWHGGSGRYGAVRISSNADVSWELEGLTLEYQQRGGA